jgi:ubiquinone/menaquinone biosynthesis C-methylase UbiE
LAVRSAYACLVSKKTCCDSDEDLYFGCGDPVTSLDLDFNSDTSYKILDLGCGSGYDLVRLAQKLNSDSFIIGVDITYEMIIKAQERIKKNRLQNVDLILADIAYLPLHCSSINAAISNCVINLAKSKSKVFKEVHRVLKERGVLVISDIVSEQRLPIKYRKNVALWSRCLTGAITLKSYLTVIGSSGFSTKILKKGLWKSLGKYKFYTVTLTAKKKS